MTAKRTARNPWNSKDYNITSNDIAQYSFTSNDITYYSITSNDILLLSDNSTLDGIFTFKDIFVEYNILGKDVVCFKCDVITSDENGHQF